MKVRNHPVLWAGIGVVVTIVLAAGVVLALQRTGDAKALSDNAPLLAAVIALGGVFTAQMVSIALEQQRSRETHELEAQRAHEAALQNYFEQVGTLLIEKPLRQAKTGDNLSTVVRAQTLTVLEDLDPKRKGILLQFLYESGLIYKDERVVSLEAANLRDADLKEANLRVANLNRANLSDADLRDADLEWADLGGADLSRADLRDADLTRANLTRANLTGANLRGADLRDTDLSRNDLTGANLSRAKLNGVNLSAAYLGETDLRDADLSRTNLHRAYMRGAKLNRANLSRADLSRAILSKSSGVTADQLELQARSLKAATMPNGRKYEARKDR